MQPIYKRHRRTCCLLAVCRYLSQSATRQVSPDAPGPGNQSGPGTLALRGRGDDDARSLSPTPCWPTLYRVVGAIFPVCPAGPRPSATADTRRTGGRGVAGEDQAVCRRGHTCGKHGAGCCKACGCVVEYDVLDMCRPNPLCGPGAHARATPSSAFPPAVALTKVQHSWVRLVSLGWHCHVPRHVLLG